MALIDEVSIRVLSGAGGNGCVSFRREKYIPRGGPNGGKGGDGGDVYLAATHDKTSLLDFKYQPKFEADRGEHGLGQEMYGRGAEDLIVMVPLGTMVYDATTNLLLHDLVEDGQKVLVARGGRGGRGNMHFKTSTNRAPRNSEPGQPGETHELRLELRLLADVGLVGLPNAGKSSFLSSVSRARPKIADYPFTTLEPHLGVVEHKEQSFAVADLPGLIEGASQGVGLGHQFLRHVARNRLLLHLVESTAETSDIVSAVSTIRAELKAYDPTLAERECWLVFTKVDLLTTEALAVKMHELEAAGLHGHFISSKTRQGLDALLDALSQRAQTWTRQLPVETAQTEPGQEPDLSSEDAKAVTLPPSEAPNETEGWTSP